MNLTLNTTKMKHRLLKQGLLALAFAVGSTAMAQSTVATLATLAKDGGDGVSVKLVDNKGTVKYLQTNNGITSITSTTAGSATTTTWQLGGTLTDATYIDVAGNAFALDGIALVDSNSEKASTNAVDLEDAKGGAAAGTGYTILVRDEATGATKKLLAADLIQSGYAKVNAGAAAEGADAIVIPSTLVPALAGNEGKISVYRNGVKLLHTTDFTVQTGVSVTVTGTADFSVYTNDVFEVQWVK